MMVTSRSSCDDCKGGVRQRVSTRWDESLKDHRTREETSEGAAVLLSRKTGDTEQGDLICSLGGGERMDGIGRVRSDKRTAM